MRISDLKLNPTDLLTLVEKYEAALERIVEDVKIKGKTLEVANREQGDLTLEYATLHSECSTVTKYFESILNSTRSEIFKKYQKTSDKLLTDRAIEKYTDSETQYLDQYHLYLELVAIRDKLGAAVEALKSRGFALRNITEVRVNGLQHSAIS